MTQVEHITIRTAQKEHYQEVCALFRALDDRGTGIGLSLLQQARQWGLEQGVTAMRLDVIANNEPAMKFYAGLGFSQVRSTWEVALDGLSERQSKKV